jgi:ABC-type dipeptide/oligopeptide/nickel transport system permease subunit
MGMNGDDLSIAAPARGLWSQGWTRFRRSRFGMAGALIVLALYLVAVAAPLLTPYDPIAQGDVPRMRYVPPCREHPLGTDKFGRDVFARVVYGSRVSLTIGLLAAASTVFLGSIVGAAAGYFGGAAEIWLSSSFSGRPAGWRPPASCARRCSPSGISIT